MRCLESQRWRQPLCKLLARQAALAAGLTGARQAAARLEELLQASRPLQQLRADLLPQPAGADGSGSAHSLIKFGAYYRNSVCYERSETAAGFSAEDLKRAEARWREQGSPKGLTSD